MKRGFHATRAARVVLVALALTACDPPVPRSGVPILLFTGNGTSHGDVAAVERILDHHHLEYTNDVWIPYPYPCFLSLEAARVTRRGLSVHSDGGGHKLPRRGETGFGLPA